MVIWPIGTVRLIAGPSVIDVERTPTRTEPSRLMVLNHDAATKLAHGLLKAVAAGKGMQ